MHSGRKSRLLQIPNKDKGKTQKGDDLHTWRKKDKEKAHTHSQGPKEGKPEINAYIALHSRPSEG